MNLGGLYYAFNAPGCFVWGRVLPSGRLFMLADYKFVHQSIETVATEIKRRTRDLGIAKLNAIFGTPEMFPKPTKERRTLEAEAPSQTFARFGLPLIPAGGERIHGWQRIQDFLRDAPDGKPWLVFGPDCKWLQRTIPALVQTSADPDDCEGEDYAANALRALLASRPQPSAERPKPTRYPWGTVGWLKQQDEPKRKGVLAR